MKNDWIDVTKELPSKDGLYRVKCTPFFNNQQILITIRFYAETKEWEWYEKSPTKPIAWRNTC